VSDVDRPREVQAIFFDAGETLVYPHPSFAELFSEVLRRKGVMVDPAVVQETVSIYSKRFADASQAEEMPPRLWSTSKESSRTFWLEVYGNFLSDVGVTDHHDELAERLFEAFSDLSNYRLHADAIPTLERLDAGGYTLGVISNFEEWLERLLEALGVTRYFPVRVISGIEGVEKPDPAIFQIALDRAGVSAAESVYVGDHPYFDVQAARQAGLFPVLIDRRGRYPDADGVRITSLEDLPEVLGIDA
jgi:putative hydrolase of the HAD superfamily